MSGHTKGPWDYEDVMGKEIGLTIVQAGLPTHEWTFIATVHNDEGEERDERHFITYAEMKANASLIAASPDLLQLAYQYRDDLHHPPAHDSRERRLKAIEVAIAKAEGRSDA